MRFISLLLLISLFIVPLAFCQTNLVEGQGMGETRDIAIEAAKRDAVQKSVGTVISSETIVKNYALLSDRILSKSIGYVKSYDIKSENVEVDGIINVLINAEVGEILDEVLRDRAAMELLLTWLSKPRVLVALTESNVGDESSRIAESAIAEELLKIGFNVVQGVDVGGASVVISALNGQGVLNTGGAELILAGHASATEGNAPQVMKNAGMTTSQAVIQAKVYRSDNRNVLAVHRAQKSRPNINATAAGAEALGFAAEELAQMLISDVVKLWSLQQSNTVPVEIEFHQATFSVRGLLLDFLAKQEIIEQVNERGLMDGVFSCQVEVEGRAQDVATILDGFSAEGKAWTVTGMTSGKVILTPR